MISRQAAVQHEPFDWSRDHDPRSWETIEKSPSYGQIVYTRYIWLGGAVVIFLFFGFGRDACGMYAKGLRAVRLNRCFPALRNNTQTPTRNASQSSTISSIGSKAKLVFGRKSNSASQSVKSWATDSRSSKATASSMAEPLSPKTMQHLETVQEHSRMPAPNGHTFTTRLSGWVGGRKTATSDVEKNLPAAPQDAHCSGFRRLTSPFRPVMAGEEMPMPMNIMRTQDVTVHSTVVAGARSPSTSRVENQGVVMVKKDVRQGSEVATDGA